MSDHAPSEPSREAKLVRACQLYQQRLDRIEELANEYIAVTYDDWGGETVRAIGQRLLALVKE